VELEERHWLPRYCRGESSCFNQLIERYGSLIYGFLHRYGIDAGLKDDLFQDIFLKVHQAASSYQPTKPLRPWLVSVALNTIRNHMRTTANSDRKLAQLKLVTPAPSIAADQVTDDKARLEWLQQQISQLPEQQREVLALNTLQGLNLKEISTITRLPLNTVKTHLRRARLNLTEALLALESQELPS